MTAPRQQREADKDISDKQFTTVLTGIEIDTGMLMGVVGAVTYVKGRSNT
jgi:hypothetical protein